MVKAQCLWDVAIKMNSSTDSTNVLVPSTYAKPTFKQHKSFIFILGILKRSNNAHLFFKCKQIFVYIFPLISIYAPVSKKVTKTETLYIESVLQNKPLLKI